MDPSQIAGLIGEATWQTLFMVVVSTFFAIVVGLPLGVIVHVTSRVGLAPNRTVNRILGLIIDIGRSLPFIILMVLVIPLTRLMVGTSIGSGAAIVPLSLSAAPLFARLVETSLREVAPGKLDAGTVMGASNFQLVRHVLLPESMPGLVAAATTTFVSLIGYSAMAGAIGGGGLGDVAIRYGYQRYNIQVLIWTVIVLIVLTMLVQFLGDRLSRALAQR
ncbi:methionine ABC transporter permease [Granulicoccus phenolivorans]|uniref:methionine ABC transporter permease n=1 Tax=Granulicoccus phenolivorans TaxID=266854 RepID=UPI00040487B7|nr:methionine ABC transporter permease [Granulicoccus phenolivorans]